jgi:DNA-binding NarL/FixJ family response regulator
MSDPIRIVLADDHPIFRAGLREVLEKQSDFRVVAECGDGEEALAAIERERPEVALLDVTMPKHDGLAVVKSLRDRQDATAIVLLTMHARDDLLREAFSQGVRGYVVKEAAVLEVVLAIREVLAGRPFISSSLSATLLTGADAPDAGLPPRCGSSPQPRCGCCASSRSSSPARRSPRSWASTTGRWRTTARASPASSAWSAATPSLVTPPCTAID